MTKPTVFNYKDFEDLKRDYQELIEVNKSLREEIRRLKKKNIKYQIWVRILDGMRNRPPRESNCSEKANSSADRPTGEWILHPENSWGETWLCSECGEKATSSVMGKPRYKYCPMCGAYMEEGGRGRCRG